MATNRSFELNPAFDPGGQLQVRLRLESDAAVQANGIHVDNITVDCYGTPSDGIFEYMSGTSMASPMVAGAAAVLFSQNPGTTPSQVKNALLSSVDQVPTLTGVTVSGGRLNLYRALTGDSNPAGSGGSGGGSAAPAPIGHGNARPNTFFRRVPGRVVRTRKRKARVVFSFGANEAGSSFRCKLNGFAYAPCSSRWVRRLAPRRYVLRVLAVDSQGAADSSAAVRRFRVVRVGG
jgi:hypothetical protein